MSGRPLRRPPRPPEGEREESRGLLISAGLHGGLVLLALFGGPLFSADEAQAVRIADVDLITSAQFDAMISQAPEGPRGEVASLVAPRPGEDAPAPDASSADAPPARAEQTPAESAPERPAPPQVDPQSAPQQAANPAARPQAPQADDAPVAPPQGVTTASPPLPAGPSNPDAPQRDAPVVPDAAPPRAADRVAPTPAPPREVIAEADQATPATRPSEDAAQTPPPPEQPAAAPREATSQIVTEADETSDEDTLAPVASAPPAGRPEAPARTRQEPTPTPPTETAQSDPAPAPQPQPQPQPARNSGSNAGSSTNAPLGPSLTSGQVEGVKLGIQKFWRMDRVTSLPNFEELKVVLRMKLDRSRKLIGNPEVVSPRSISDPRWRVAVQTAQIAATRAGRDGFQLPADSYGRWQLIEITFNPGRGVSF